MNTIRSIQLKHHQVYSVTREEYEKAHAALTPSQFNQLYFTNESGFFMMHLPSTDELNVLLLDKIHSKVTFFWVLVNLPIYTITNKNRHAIHPSPKRQKQPIYC